VKAALAVAFVLCLAAPTAHAGSPASCSDVGEGQHPHAKKGRYEIATQDSVTHLWFTDAATGARTQLGNGEWARTASMVLFEDWLYVVADGKLFRANPETGEWFPKPRSGAGKCAWYEGWVGPLWVENGALHAVRSSRKDPDLREIVTFDFERRTARVTSSGYATRADAK
jgi:hypothetical protein